MALGCIVIWLLAACPDLLAPVCPFFMAFLMSTQCYGQLSDFLPCAALVPPLVLALLWHFAVWPVTLRLGRSGMGLALVSIATLLGGCDVITRKQAVEPLSLYYTLGLGVGMLVLYVLFRSHLTEKRSYDLHRRFAEIFCALGLCMALAVLLAYGKAWLAEGHIGGVLYLSYRNFATSVLLTALPMPFYLSLRHRGHLATAAVLAGTLVNRFAHVNIDGWVGLAVAVFILRSGWGAAKDTINPLLGESPDPELVKQLRELVLSHPQVVGMHDLIIHDYGPGRRLCSFHAEVPQDADILDAHDAIDHIEREIKEKFGIETTVHMDPIATADEKVNQLRRQVADLARVVEPEMTIHDFRVVRGPTHTNVIFDAVVPHKCRLTDEEVLQRLRQAVSALDPTYQAVIQIDRAYVE